MFLHFKKKSLKFEERMVGCLGQVVVTNNVSCLTSRRFDNFCISESYTDFYASKFIYKSDNQLFDYLK